MTSNKEKHILSKSTFIKGVVCPKALWLNKNRRDLIPPTPATMQFVFDQGKKIGMLARQLYPDGADATPKTFFDYGPSIELTKQLIAGGQPMIYEAAFLNDGVLCAVDILVKKEDGWHGYEVKSSTKPHDIQIQDCALQYAVMKAAGLELKDISIIHLNSDYERIGELEIEKLFKTESVYYLVIALQDEIAEKVNELKRVVTDKNCPDTKIGYQCTHPYTCEFKEHCWKDVPKESILDFTGVRLKERFELFHSGTIRIADLKNWETLKEPNRFVVECHRNAGIYINDEKLRSFMRSFTYPLYFMDFETIGFALPPFDLTSPYDQIPFQYSIHILESENAEPVHYSYLASPDIDFREDFTKALLRDLGERGTVFAYNKGFEKSKLAMLALYFPQYEEQINSVVERLVDLADPFSKRWYYDNKFSCSYSIKTVLPVLAPKLSYKDLPVNNGEVASQLFMQMMMQPEADWSKQRDDLLAYCGMDTWAMVEIFRFLNTIV